MAKDEETEEEVDDEFDDEFDDEDIDLDDEDIELDDEDLEIEVEEAEEEAPRGKRVSDDDLVEMSYKETIHANPKRAKALKKRASLIETVLDDAKLDSEEGVKEAWESLNQEVDTKIRKPYSIKEEYSENQVIEHPSFGVGFVNQVLSETKVEVIFEEGVKRLVCNKG